MSFSRRQMMKMSAGALIAANLWPGRLRAAETPTKPLKFIVTNDFHYAEDACTPFFEGLVKEFNAVDKLDFVIIAGDLVDDGTLAECNAIHAIIAKIKVPFYITCGNHDPISQTDRAPWESVFGKKLNFSIENNGWQVVALDSSDGLKASGVNAAKETVEYAGTLPATIDKNKPTFVYTHFPVGPAVQNRLANADTLLDPFKQLNVTAIFSGHYHAFTKTNVLTDTIAVTNRCCSRKRANHDNTFQKGYFIIEAAEGKYKRTFIEYGTDFKDSATPNNKPLPATRPVQPEDKSAPWY